MFDQELRKQKALFAIADQAGLVSAFAIALTIHDPSGKIAGQLSRTDQPQIDLGLIAVAFGWMLVFRTFDLYRLRNGGVEESIAIVKACAVSLASTLLLAYMVHVQLPRLTILVAAPASIALVMLNRAVLRRAMRHFYADPNIAIPLLLVGFNPLARYLCDQIVEDLSQYELLGFLAEEPGEYRGHRVVGSADQIGAFAARRRNLEVAIVIPEAKPDHVERVVESCKSHRVRWWVVPSLFNLRWGELRVDMVGTVPLIGPRCSNIEGLNFILKRGFDLVMASAALFGLAPVMTAAAIAIWLCDGLPLLFRQTRVGIHGHPFQLLKFRTMKAEASDSLHREYIRGWISEGTPESPNGSVFYKMFADPRITAVGRWLRRFSLDELPQLINVLRGDMSLIGPRPALPYELEHYKSWHRHRLDAPPGITGLWQVSGRNSLSFDEMVRLDIEYIENWSLRRDFHILLRTVPAMLGGGGV